MKINNINLKNDINLLNKLIAEYEEVKLNLFDELKDSCINWQDGNSVDFENKIYLEKVESDNILRTLTDKRDILNFIYDKYSDLGKKIKCDLNNRSALLRSIESCQSQANSIINEFYKIDNSFYYWEQQSISNQKNKILKVKNDLSEVKNSITKMFDKIEKIEKEIKVKIKKIDEIKINNFDYNVASTGTRINKGIVNGTSLEKNIEKIKYYSSEEIKLLNKIDKELNEVSKNYNSNNTTLFLNSGSNFKTNIDSVYKKRNKYTTILNETIIKYNELTAATQQIFDKEV